MSKHTEAQKILLHRLSGLITEMFSLGLDCAIDWVATLSDMANGADEELLRSVVWSAEAVVVTARGRQRAEKYCDSPLTTRDIACGLIESPDMQDLGRAFPFSHTAEKAAYIAHIRQHFGL